MPPPARSESASASWNRRPARQSLRTAPECARRRDRKLGTAPGCACRRNQNLRTAPLPPASPEQMRQAELDFPAELPAVQASVVERLRRAAGEDGELAQRALYHS
jgi:hypothetical protein